MDLYVTMNIRVPDTVEDPEEVVANDIRDMLNGDLDSSSFDAYDLAVTKIEVSRA